MKIVTIILILSFTAVFASAKVIYVDCDATGADNGTTWANAYNHLQNALTDPTLAYSDEIRVAAGTYYPDTTSAVPAGSGNRAASFVLITGTSLKGAYAGVGQPNPDARDFILHETILSGDLAQNDICGPLHSSRAENTCNIVIATLADPNTILDGFTITGANANVVAGTSYSGGGIYNDGGSPNITSCSIEHNAAIYAGGMFCDNATNAVLTSCTFKGNYGSTYHGGMYNIRSTVNMTNCLLVGNLSASSGSGMTLGSNANVTVTNCTVAQNKSQGTGAGIGAGGIGPKYVTVKNSILWANSDSSGTSESTQIGGSGLNITINYSSVQGWTGALGGTGNSGSDPNFALLGYWDNNSTPANPNDDFWVDGDYHLMSKGGRYDPSTQTWVFDTITSPCIDAGDPNSSIGSEPLPNGGIINMGRYGGTSQASKSCYILQGDLNEDCVVNFFDLAILARNWLKDSRIP